MLDKEHCEGSKVEDDWNIERSQEFVDDSCKLMEECSVAPFDITTSILVNWVIVNYRFDMVFSKGFKIELGDFHDDMKGNKVDDADLNFNLEWKKPAVNSFCIYSSHEL